MTSQTNESPMRTWIRANAGKTYTNYINGEWAASMSGQTYPLYESALPGNKLGDFSASGPEDVDRAVRAADEAFASWKKSSGSARAAILYRFAELLGEHGEELAYIISAEQGKVLAESRGEVKRAADEARFAAGEAMRIDGQTLPSENEQVRIQTVRYPVGVIAAIAPWNFPLVTPVRKIAPALAYGCCVVLKPASSTPWTSVKLMELFAEAGVPKGVVNLLLGSGGRIGDALVAHPLIKGISFTGSTALGLKINEAAAGRLAKTQMELGGKNPALILDFGDLAFAAQQIVSSAFGCSGQRCTAISRVIVLEEQADALIAQLKEKMEAIRVGPAWEGDSTIGPLIDRRQYESVMKYIETGKQEGAVIETGGHRARLQQGNDKQGLEEGFYLAPTLFTGVRKDMTIAKEEIFGPVLVVLTVKDTEEAVELANSTEYGLAASVFTDRLDTAQQVTEKLESGMVHVNHGTASQAHVPFGGVKHSGYGAYSIGHTNQDFFTGMKAVYVRGFS